MSSVTVVLSKAKKKQVRGRGRVEEEEDMGWSTKGELKQLDAACLCHWQITSSNSLVHIDQGLLGKGGGGRITLIDPDPVKVQVTFKFLLTDKHGGYRSAVILMYLLKNSLFLNMSGKICFRLKTQWKQTLDILRCSSQSFLLDWLRTKHCGNLLI